VLFPPISKIPLKKSMEREYLTIDGAKDYPGYCLSG
jgi:hypothetical protein